MKDESFRSGKTVTEAPPGRILVVDDDPVASGLLAATLAAAGHKVVEVGSGEEALAHLSEPGTADSGGPEVVFLDIEMGMGMDGYETCRRLRSNKATRDLPVIFLSGHDELEDRLSAYDAGGSDFMSKPFAPDEVLRKAAISIRHFRRQMEMEQDGRTSSDTATTAINTVGESGITLKFTRAALGCRTQHALATQLIQSMGSFGLDCHVQIRVPTETLTLTPHGAASPLEESVFEKMISMGRIFSFRNRTIINYDSVSILIVNMPTQEEDLCGRIRDHAAMIAEAAELAVDNIELRANANARAEELRELANVARHTVEELRASFREMQMAIRHELESMANDIEKMYYRLALSNAQEYAISNAVRDAVERVLTLYERGSELDGSFAGIVAGLTKAGEYTVSQEDEAAPTIELW